MRAWFARSGWVLPVITLFFVLLEAEWGGLLPRVFLLGIMLSVIGLLLGATGRARFSLTLGLAILTLALFAARQKANLLQRPMLWSDLRFLTSGTLFETGLHYLKGWQIFAAAAGLIAAGLYLAWIWRLDGAAARQWRGSRRNRGAGMAAMALAAIPMGTLWEAPEIRVASPMHVRRHPLSTFVASITGFDLNLRPLDGSPVLSPVKFEGEGAVSRISARQPALPDLVGILAESIFDPRTLYRTSFNADEEAYFHPAGGIHGKLRVHTFGGGTWLSSFSLLTAIPGTAIGDMGFYVPHLLVGKIHDSLPALLKRLGYRTIVLFPVENQYVNAETFYRSMGFEEFYSPYDLGWDRKQVWHHPDSDFYAEVLNRIRIRNREEPSRPIFIWMRTILNHGPHGPPGCLECPFQEFKSRLTRSSADLRRFLADLRKVESGRPFSVMHFGDHRPTLAQTDKSSSKRIRDSNDDAYHTYFAIPALPSPPAAQAFPRTSEAEPLDLGFLAGLWLEAAGVPLDSLWTERNRIARDCSGIYMNEMTPGCMERLGRLHSRILSEGRLVLD